MLKVCLSLITVLLVWCVGAQANPTDRFQKGINLNHVMSYPAPSGWPRFISPQSRISDRELVALKEAGFDHIRLLIDPEIYLQETVVHRRKLDKRLKDIIKRILDHDLDLVAVNFTRHTAKEWNPERVLTSFESSNYKKFRAHIFHLATLLSSYDQTRVRFVMVSEPQKECIVKTGTDWTVFQRNLFAAARAAAPKLSLGVTGGCWSTIEGLKRVDMSDFDDNSFVDIHFYAPFSFTHQGATWTLPAQRYLSGLTYPSKPETALRRRVLVEAQIQTMFAAHEKGDLVDLEDAKKRGFDYLAERHDKNTLKTYFEQLEAWRKRQNIPTSRIAIGEFGALRPVKPIEAGEQTSRLNWIKDTRRLIEDYGYGWSMWDYFPPFSLLSDVETRTLDAPTIKALGLRATNND